MTKSAHNIYCAIRAKKDAAVFSIEQNRLYSIPKGTVIYFIEYDKQSTNAGGVARCTFNHHPEYPELGDSVVYATEALDWEAC